MTAFNVDPIRLFEIQGNVSTVVQVAGNFLVGNNQLVVAAVAGKRIRVMKWDMQGLAAGLPVFRLKSNSAGTVIYNDRAVPGIGAGLSDKLPMDYAGYCETATGHALYIDVVTADLSLNLGYIYYTP